MRDRFFGKTWIYWAQLVAFGVIGGFSVPMGVMFWTGAMLDANGQPRPQAGPPMVIIGGCMLIIAVMALFNILGRRAPMVRCFRECIEVNLVGATALDAVPLVPGWARVFWAVVSLQGFKSQRVAILWGEFEGAVVGGPPMAHWLVLKGRGLNLSRGRECRGITFKQVALRDHPKVVAEALNGFAADEVQRKGLAKWEPELPSAKQG